MISNNYFTGTLPTPSTKNILTTLYLDDNYISGSISSTFLSSLSGLLELLLYNNHLTGTVPSAFSTLLSLSILVISMNNLEGPIPPTLLLMPSLTILDVSNNHLTGLLSLSEPSSSNLQVFAAGSNCFVGSIPNTLCLFKNLTTIILDGMHSSPICRPSPLLSYTIGGYKYSSGSLSRLGSGGIELPVCLFVELPLLHTLHLSGNKLTGTIPSNTDVFEWNALDMNMAPSLNDFSLAHNLLKGSIPYWIQSRSSWVNLDLSFNKLDGNIGSFRNGTDYLSTTPYSLSLEVNRLSGDVPFAIHNLRSISILTGNVFQCSLLSDVRSEELPVYDIQVDAYSCGSNSTNLSIFVWFLLIFIIMLLLKENIKIIIINFYIIVRDMASIYS
jgi:hypothetical protein